MRCDQASEKEASTIPALWDTPEKLSTNVRTYPLEWAREKAWVQNSHQAIPNSVSSSSHAPQKPAWETVGFS